MSTKQASGPRCVAIVGPYLSGKTTLLESMLAVTGAVSRKGSVSKGNTVGDSSAEARAHEMSVEANVATTTFMDESLTFIDCPGSVEFQQDARNVVTAVDAAVVVVDAEMAWPVAIAPILKSLQDSQVPTAIFVNKIDTATGQVSGLLDALSPASERPLVMRHLPLIEDGTINGYVDLASERAYVYRAGAASEIVDLPDDMSEQEKADRFHLLETLADYDDDLMEQLLEDVEPDREVVYKDLTKEFQDGLIVPVFLGAAETDNGVRRLLKALRHEVPEVATLLERVGAKASGDTLAQVVKTYHTPHGGKLSVARILSGKVKDGDSLSGDRIAGLFHMMGGQNNKIAEAVAGDTVAMGRMEGAKTGDTLAPKGGSPDQLPRADLPQAIYGKAVQAAKRADEVKLSTALAKVHEEDPSISLVIVQDTHQMVLWGQGEIHLRVAAERLKNRYSLDIVTDQPAVPYKEAIRKGKAQRSRFKRQTGGHGQFGDVEVEIKPLPRGEGFVFENKITGGAIPRQYIQSVEHGVVDYLSKGPLGFNVVDVCVTLVDGGYHAVDSSDIAFRTAARMAMTEAMPECSPVLLEPVLAVEVSVPSDFTAKINGVISGRRGQILGFEPKEGWNGWDVVTGHMPQSEVHDLIVELRSLTHGVGSFNWKFDHLAELVGREADQIVQAAAEKKD